MRDIEGYIKKYEDSFSKAECRIADYVIKHREEIFESSVDSIARATDTSGATVVRFCRTIGFRGFMDFKYQMQRNVLYVVEQEQQINRTDDVCTVKNKIIQYSKTMLEEFRAAIDDNEMERAVDAIVRAKRIQIFAEGGSASMAEFAKSSMIHIGFYCSVESDASMQIMAAEYLDEDDVAIAMTHSGRIRSTVEALEVAKRRNACTIAITGTHGTPVCDFADIVLACDVDHQFDLSDFQGSRLEEFTVLSILQMALLLKVYNKSAEVVKRVSLSVEEFRRYNRGEMPTETANGIDRLLAP